MKCLSVLHLSQWVARSRELVDGIAGVLSQRYARRRGFLLCGAYRVVDDVQFLRGSALLMYSTVVAGGRQVCLRFTSVLKWERWVAPSPPKLMAVTISASSVGYVVNI